MKKKKKKRGKLHEHEWEEFIDFLNILRRAFPTLDAKRQGGVSGAERSDFGLSL